MQLLKQLSIKTKLIVMLLVVSLCAMFASTFICSSAGKSLLTEKVFNQLTSKALYIIIAGQALVTVMKEFGMNLEVMTILRGEFFGEMALFTGEPSPVSITAVDDLQVLVIYSDAVNLMIERQPSLGREIGQIIEAQTKAVNMAQQAGVSFNAEVELPIRILK